VSTDGTHDKVERMARELLARARELPVNHPERPILLEGARFLLRLARRLKHDE